MAVAITNVLMALVLFPQDELSSKAKELLNGLDQVRVKVREINALAGELRAMQEGGKADSKEFRQKVNRFNGLKIEIQTDITTLQRDIARAAAVTPDDLGVIDARSQGNELIGDDAKAAEDLDKLLAKKPDHVPYVVRRAGLDRKLGGYEAARSRLAPVFKKDPAHVGAAAEDGLCAFALNDFKGAVERLEAASKGLSTLTPQLQAEIESTLPIARGRIALWDAEEALRTKEAKASDLPRVRLVTSKGEIELELFENEAPVAVANFVALSEKRYYDGTRFHRVIPNFMVQGGDPNSKNDDPDDDGKGGPGYAFKDELPVGAYRRHFRGSLSMANSGPNTNGSQFFITHIPTHWLDGKHVVFGRVTRGMEVVDLIRAGDTLQRVEVIRKREHEYKTAE